MQIECLVGEVPVPGKFHIADALNGPEFLLIELIFCPVFPSLFLLLPQKIERVADIVRHILIGKTVPVVSAGRPFGAPLPVFLILEVQLLAHHLQLIGRLKSSDGRIIPLRLTVDGSHPAVHISVGQPLVEHIVALAIAHFEETGCIAGALGIRRCIDQYGIHPEAIGQSIGKLSGESRVCADRGKSQSIPLITCSGQLFSLFIVQSELKRLIGMVLFTEPSASQLPLPFLEPEVAKDRRAQVGLVGVLELHIDAVFPCDRAA